LQAQQLMVSFPIGTKLGDGSDFWSSPKRPPRLLQFDPTQATHMAFIASTAQLYARVYGIRVASEVCEVNALRDVLSGVIVPPFRSKQKKIVTDESVAKTDFKAELEVGSIFVIEIRSERTTHNSYQWGVWYCTFPTWRASTSCFFIDADWPCFTHTCASSYRQAAMSLSTTRQPWKRHL